VRLGNIVFICISGLALGGLCARVDVQAPELLVESNGLLLTHTWGLHAAGDKFRLWEFDKLGPSEIRGENGGVDGGSAGLEEVSSGRAKDAQR
jgi:hypothetical protein